jgi:hypothetical protein
VFLRTPKSKGQSKFIGALRVTQWETVIGAIFLTVGVAAFIARPGFLTLWLGFLLAWQASLYLAAPYFSLLSIQTAPARGIVQQQLADPYRGPVVAENTAAKWAWVTLAVIVTMTLVALQIPLPTELPFYARFQPADVPPQNLIVILPTPTPLPPTPVVPTVTQFPTLTQAPSPTPIPSSTVTLAPTSTLPPTTTPTSPSPSPTSTFTPPAEDTTVPPTDPPPTGAPPTDTPPPPPGAPPVPTDTPAQ